MRVSDTTAHSQNDKVEEKRVRFDWLEKRCPTNEATG